MPSFLFKSEQFATPAYNHPLELAGKALLYRDAKYKEGINTIRNKYDTILNYKTMHPENTEFLQNEIKNSLSNLDKLSGADLSLPGNVSTGLHAFDSITEDKKLREDIAFTAQYDKAINEYNSLKSSKDPSGAAVQNLDLVLSAKDEYLKSNPRTNPNAKPPSDVRYEPYYNFEKNQADIISKIKADIRTQKDDIHYKVNIGGEVVALNEATQQQVEELTKSRIAIAIYNDFNTNPQARRQAQIDHIYNDKYNLYDKQPTIDRIKDDIKASTDRYNEIQTELNDGRISKDNITKAKEYLKEYQNDIDVNNLKLNKISDPTYKFTQSDYMDSYVEKMFKLYGYRQEKDIKAMPGSSEILKLQGDIFLEHLKTQRELQTEARKKAEEFTESGPINPDGSPNNADKTFYKTAEELAANGEASIQSVEHLASFMDAKYDNNDNTIKVNVTKGNDIILVPPTTAPYAGDVKTAVTVNSYETSKAKLNATDWGIKILVGPPGHATFSSTPKQFTDIELFKLYQSAKKVQKHNIKLTPIQTEILKFENIYKSLNIDENTKSADAVGRLTAARKDTGKSQSQQRALTEIGVLLNDKFSAAVQFIPSDKPIVALGEQGQPGSAGVRGKIIVSASALGDKIKNAIVDSGGTITEWTGEVGDNTSGDTVSKREKKYAISVIMPVNRPAQDIIKSLSDLDVKSFSGKEKLTRERNNETFYNHYINMTRGKLDESKNEDNTTNRYKDVIPKGKERMFDKETVYQRNNRINLDSQLKISPNNKDSVSLKYVDMGLKQMVLEIQNTPGYEKVFITSANDQSDNLNRQNSLHRKGSAIDLTYNESLYNFLLNDPDFNKRYKVVPPDHGTAKHIHIELRD